MDNPMEQGVFADLSQIEQVLLGDVSGDRARAMISYFGEASRASESLLLTALSDSERQLTSQLVEGLRAARRIVGGVWESMHCVSLAL